jgi:nicotinate phosphoribosyltransferase
MIIDTLLDLDLYKLTMMQLAWKNFPNLRVKFQFNNRTDITLFSHVNEYELLEEIKHVTKLEFKKEEIEYLSTLGIFEQKFLNYLSTYKIPDTIYINNIGNDVKISTIGYWKDVCLWETIVLSIVNELYYKGKYSEKERNNHLELGKEKLSKKLEILKQKGITNVTDFGTRRRFSTLWQDYVVSQIKDHPSFVGTSNVKLSMKYGMKPFGTNAHELYMIFGGYYGDTDENLLNSHSKIMNQWYDMYGYDLSIGLTDTFGTEFFFNDFADKAHLWKGVRHDSGDPFEFGEKVIKYYEEINIDPKEKLIVFSDGLSLDKIIELTERFKDRINISFGWGTKLTNDVGFETLSIVMKAVHVISDEDKLIDRSLVKLSDNLNKHTGQPKEIERYKRVFNYKNTNKEKLEV